ncbi:hypothetical protein EV424DRAFT_698568 [Suillus variegatus]|nr:hypothetical protein EV424DRAFT_698568 [Suillus variegatus]
MTPSSVHRILHHVHCSCRRSCFRQHTRRSSFSNSFMQHNSQYEPSYSSHGYNFEFLYLAIIMDSDHAINQTLKYVAANQQIIYHPPSTWFVIMCHVLRHMNSRRPGSIQGWWCPSPFPMRHARLAQVLSEWKFAYCLIHTNPTRSGNSLHLDVQRLMFKKAARPCLLVNDYRRELKGQSQASSRKRHQSLRRLPMASGTCE